MLQCCSVVFSILNLDISLNLPLFQCKTFFAQKKKTPAPSRAASALPPVVSTEPAADKLDNVEEVKEVEVPEGNENEAPESRPPTPSEVDEDEDIVDLRAMSTVGGVMYLDLLKLPPQAKKVGSWVIQDSKFRLVPSPYHPPPPRITPPPPQHGTPSLTLPFSQ